MDFSTSKITQKKVFGNNVDFSTIEITLKKVGGNNVDLSINKITSKKYVEMMWRFKFKTKKNIVLEDMIPDMLSDKKPQLVITELFVRCRSLNIFLVLVSCYCAEKY